MGAPVVEADIPAFVEALRDAYVTLRRQTRKDSVGLGKRAEPQLRRLAGALYHRGGDPYAYMQFCFDIAAEHARDISYTRIIFSDGMINRFFMARDKRRAELELLLRLQADDLATYLDLGRKLEDILRDDHIGFSPPFRFVAAVQAGNSDLVEEFREEAEEMMKFEPLYRDIYRKWLPEDLKHGRTCTGTGAG